MRRARPGAGYAGAVTTEDPTAESPAPAGLEPGSPVTPGRAGAPERSVDPESSPPVHASRAAEALGTAAPTEPLDVSTRSVILVGSAAWALALVVTLVVPALHTGERSWWPWACVTGIALGAFALWYLGRGTDDTARV